MQGGFPKWLTLTCTNLMNSMIRVILMYSCDYGLAGFEDLPEKNGLNFMTELTEPLPRYIQK